MISRVGKATLKINLSHPQLKLAIHQLTAIGIPEKSDLVQSLLDPLHLPCVALPCAGTTDWAEGLAPRLCDESYLHPGVLASCYHL